MSISPECDRGEHQPSTDDPGPGCAGCGCACPPAVRVVIVIVSTDGNGLTVHLDDDGSYSPDLADDMCARAQALFAAVCADARTIEAEE